MSYSRWDNFPVSNGHAEVIPKRHVESYFELSQQEVESLYELLLMTKKEIDERYSPNAYNVGVNVGLAAGQTVFHVHIHLIPRYVGDVTNSRGGVRNIIPGKGDY